MAILSGCSAEPTPDRTHRTEDSLGELTQAPETSAPSPITVELDAGQLSEAVTSSKTNILQGVIEPLSRQFFTENVINDSLKNGTPRAGLLRVYNQALLRLAAEQPDSGRLQELLAQYEDMVLLGCSDDLRNCRTLPTFQKSAHSFDVWKLILSRGRSVSDQRRLLLVGWKLCNERESDYVNLKYLGLSEAIEADAITRQDSALERTHISTVRRILASPDRLRGKPEYEAYLRHLLDDDSAGRATGKLALLREQVLLSSAEAGLLREAWFGESLKKSTTLGPLSYETNASKLLSARPQVAKRFGVQYIEKTDARFYLVDRVYTGTWLPSIARSLWIGSRPTAAERAELQTLMSQYARMQILALVVQSNERMAEFYRDRTHFKSNDLHVEASRAAQELQERWVKLYAAMARLRSLALLVFGNGSPEVAALKIDQDTLNETSLHLVSYPMLLLMGYQMAVNQFVLYGWWGSVDSVWVIQKLLEGELSASFFDFTQGGRVGLRKFSPTELLYAFHFALETETFEMEGSSPEGFIKVVTDELMKGALTTRQYAQGMRTFTRFWKDPPVGLKTEYDAVRRACSYETEIDQLPPTERESKRLAPRPYRLRIPFEDVEEGLLVRSDLFGLVYDEFNNRSRYTDHTNVYKNGLFFLSNEHEQGLEHARVSLGERLKYIEDLVEIYRRFLKREGKPTDIPAIAAIVDRGKHESRVFYTSVYKVFNELILPCFASVARKEFDAQNQLTRMEYEWLKQVFRDFQRLKTLPSGSPESAAILSRYKVEGFENQGYSGYDHFDLEKGRFVAHKIDGVMRIVRHMKQGLVTEEARFAPALPYVEVLYRTQLKDLPSVSSPEPIFMNLDFPSAEEFALSNMKYLRMTSKLDNGFAAWPTEAGLWADNLFDEYPAVLSGLLKSGEVEVYSPDQPECLQDQFQVHCKVEKARLSEESVRQQMYQILQMVVGNEEDRETYRLLGVQNRGKRYIFDANLMNNSKVELSWGNGLLINTRSGTPMGYFDALHVMTSMATLGWGKQLPWMMNSDAPGGTTEPTMLPLVKGIQYYKARINEPLFLFPMRKDISEYLFKSYKKRVEDEFAAPRFIETIAKHAEQEDQKAGVVRDYPLKTIHGQVGRSYYINPVLIENRIATEAEFHRNTGYIFLTDQQRAWVKERESRTRLRQ